MEGWGGGRECRAERGQCGPGEAGQLQLVLYISNVPLCNARRGFPSATLVRTALALAPPTAAAYCPAAGGRSGTSGCSWTRGGRRREGHGHPWEGNEKFITFGEFSFNKKVAKDTYSGYIYSPV